MTTPPPRDEAWLRPTRSVAAAGRKAMQALLWRDLCVLGKSWVEFLARTLFQPVLLVFVFLYVFPVIGEGIGQGTGLRGEDLFATTLVPGLVAMSIAYQGFQSITFRMSMEFGHTREIEDRVQAPCPLWMVPVARMLSSAAQGALSACIVLPATLLVHAPGVEVRVAEHWWIICTVIPLSAVTMASLGLLVGASVQPRSMGVVVGFLYLPMVFLGGVYYRWTSLSAIRVGDFPWLQALTLINPLTYVAEGMRAAYTDTAHMPLYVVYPGLVLFAAVLLGLGIHSFRQRVLS